MVADLLFKRGFILIYSSFLRNNVMIFQILVCRFLTPNRLLEAKHILFYYRADCLALERRRSGLRQVTKTDNLLDKKIKDVRKQYHSNKNYSYCGLMTDWG